MAVARHPALVAEISGGSVHVWDPVLKESRYGETLAQCLSGASRGREVVLCFGQRNSFIRQVPVPAVGDREMQKLVAAKLSALLPIPLSEVVFGYRVCGAKGGGARFATVGIVRTELIRRAISDARAEGLNVRACVPRALGSWLVVHERRLVDVATVTRDGETISIDVFLGGELCYSRSIPQTSAEDELEEALDCTFQMAKVAPLPTLALTTEDVLGHLSHVQLIERHLFSLELPERRAEEQQRKTNLLAWRALAAAFVALATVSFGYERNSREQVKANDVHSLQSRLLAQAETRKSEAQTKLARVKANASILRATFEPAQTMTDVLGVLGTEAPKQVWLTGVTFERGKPLLLRGTSLNGNAVSKFAAKLNGLPRFRGMKVLYTNQAKIEKQTVVQFAISGAVVGNLAVDEVPAREVTR